jgi:hypothetical protein
VGTGGGDQLLIVAAARHEASVLAGPEENESGARPSRRRTLGSADEVRSRDVVRLIGEPRSSFGRGLPVTRIELRVSGQRRLLSTGLAHDVASSRQIARKAASACLGAVRSPGDEGQGL